MTLDKLPDIGLTAHGYVLDLMGEMQQLQIRTWPVFGRTHVRDGRLPLAGRHMVSNEVSSRLGKRRPGTSRSDCVARSGRVMKTNPRSGP